MGRHIPLLRLTLSFQRMETGLIIIALLYLALSVWAIAGVVMRSRSLARTHRR